MNCRFCGAELPEGAMFCGECGRAVVLVDAAPVRPAPVGEVAAVAAQVAPQPIAFSSADAAPDDPADHVGVAHPVPICPQCGTAVEADEVFCGECGFVLRSVPPPLVAASEPEPEPVAEPELAAEPEPDLAPAPELAPEPGPALPPAEAPPLLDAAFPAPVRDLSATEVVPALEPDLEFSIERAPRPDPFPGGMQRADIEDLEATRLTVDPLAGQRFVLQFSTGENVTVSGAGLVGRNPVAQPGEYVDQLIAVFDASKSVSKTHLEFGQEAGRFWVSDRFSTNGSVVRQPDAEPRRCEPGRRYFVARGTRVDIGEQFFVVS